MAGKQQNQETELVLKGLATDHIWIMQDGPETHPIGIRMDCGDSGVVYLSLEQAKELAGQLGRIGSPAPPDVKRYVVFGYEEYYPAGGWGDFKGSYETLEEAKTQHPVADEIVDLTTGKQVFP
jgi:hypothetical protein